MAQPVGHRKDCSYCQIAPSKKAITKICIHNKWTRNQNRKTSGILQDLLFQFSCIIILEVNKKWKNI